MAASPVKKEAPETLGVTSLSTIESCVPRSIIPSTEKSSVTARSFVTVTLPVIFTSSAPLFGVVIRRRSPVAIVKSVPFPVMVSPGENATPISHPPPISIPVEVMRSVPASVRSPKFNPCNIAVWFVEAILFVAVKASTSIIVHVSALSTSSP